MCVEHMTIAVYGSYVQKQKTDEERWISEINENTSKCSLRKSSEVKWVGGSVFNYICIKYVKSHVDYSSNVLKWNDELVNEWINMRRKRKKKQKAIKKRQFLPEMNSRKS